MEKIFEVLSAYGQATRQDDINRDHEERYLTLTDQGGQSDNRYYVRLTGKDACLNWQKGDLIMVVLSLRAYKHQGQWHICHPSDALEMIDVDIIKNTNSYE